MLYFYAMAPAPPAHALARLRRAACKVLVSAFVIWHAAAVTWWNIPRGPYPVDVRGAALPQWFLDAEDAVSAWKNRTGPQSDVIWYLERYTERTAVWQNWWMFAPNPLSFHRYIEVFAVIGQASDGRPLYDPEPLYTSYRGSLEEELTRFSDWRNAFASYTHDHKFVENLTLGDWNPQLQWFARWWGERYMQRTGRRPPAFKGIHIICHEYPNPPAYSGIHAKDVTPRKWVIWWEAF